MPMAVVKVRVVRMLMPHGFMPVPVGVWLGDRPIVTMLMVLVMHVGMVVLQRLVVVFMIVPFRQVQP